MTDTARLVLADCRASLDRLRSDPVGIEWKLHWIAATALLRTVGAALKKVDAKKDARLAEIIRHRWTLLQESKPEPTIFWGFIADERNNILKEYKFGAGINITVRPGTAHINLNTGEVTEAAPSRPTLYDFVMNDGTFKGKDQRDVVSEAIDWWDDYLSAIEVEYAKKET